MSGGGVVFAPRPPVGPSGRLARALAFAASLALAASACGSSADDGVATAVSSAANGSPATSSATNQTGGSSSSSAATTAGGGSSTTASGSGSTAAANEGGLGVGPDGLQVIDGARITQLPFGTGRDEVFTVLESILGTSPTVTEASPECPNQATEQLLWPGQLSVDIRDDEMISWHLDRGSPLTTVSGVGLGVTRAEVESSIVIVVDESSLGTEFATEGGADDGGGMGGLFSGPADTDTVTELWGGEICAFR